MKPPPAVTGDAVEGPRGSAGPNSAPGRPCARGAFARLIFAAAREAAPSLALLPAHKAEATAAWWLRAQTHSALRRERGPRVAGRVSGRRHLASGRVLVGAFLPSF